MDAPSPQPLVERFRSARRDPALTVLEGFHALKHALRFDAELVEVVSADLPRLDGLAAQLAPDLSERIRELADPVAAEVLAALVPHSPPTGVVAIARRAAVDVEAVLATGGPAPVVLLERPRDLGNVGACVRVAAAAEAAGVLTTGRCDPWHPTAVRGAAGLHYALPVGAIAELPPSDRPLLALDPEGDPLRPDALPDRAVLAFGGERHGLSDELVARAEAKLSLPMRAGVSSINLATSVAAVLFAIRLRQG